MGSNYLNDFIKRSLEEDLGDGDHTSLACIPAQSKGKAKLLIKEKGILAGIRVALEVFNTVDKDLITEVLIHDGEEVIPGNIAFFITGKQQSILISERLVLNIMQRMSGIATNTRQYVNRISGFRTRILDTRKTTPGIRFLEKEAVKIGGGENHRMGLYDMILIKDNHIDYAGGIKAAITLTRDYLLKTGRKLKIEIEARNLEEVEEILSAGGIDRIMLDNFSLEETRKAVQLIDNRVETESSGKMSLEMVRDYAACGVDYISAGALTHSVKSLDMSLKAIPL
jgi:nicotinate-nucleotide pyrophosphorylase (carboxylating)